MTNNRHLEGEFGDHVHRCFDLLLDSHRGAKMHTEMKRRRIYLFLVHVHFSEPSGASWQRNKLLQAISTHKLIDDLPITIVPFVVDVHMVTCRAYILLTSMTLPSTCTQGEPVVFL
jgi:hypothetical protein